ncbi:MAG: phage holin family protein [Dehalococcoidia bacterium]
MTLQDDRSLGELFSDFSRDSARLLRQEVALARAELSEKASDVLADLRYVAIGGAMAYAGVLVVLAGVTLLLGQAIPLWGAALLVGIAVIVPSVLVILTGINRLRHRSLQPTQAVESVKEDAEWLKSQVS